MIFAQIPIFITARGHNDEEFNKNKECLKFSYLFIKEQNLFKQTYIISDNEKLIEYAKELGFINTIHYPCGSQKDIKYLEYLATYRYGVEHNYHPDWIILLNVNQLFKNASLIADCIQYIDSKYDVVASYTEISNRSHFFIDDKYNKLIINNDVDHLLSSEHCRVKMIDAAIYAIRTEFAFSCMEYDDPSIAFWKGKIKYFKNKTLYTDIYNMEDIQKYYDASNILSKVQNIKAF